MQRILSKKWAAMLLAFGCTLLWGSAYPVIKLSYEKLNILTTGDKLMFAAERFFLAGVMVFFAACALRKRPAFPEKRLIGWAMLYGAVQTGLMYLFNYIGVANTSATKTSLLTATSAFLAVLFAPLFFKGERLSARKITGIALGFSGVILVNTGFSDGAFSFFGEGFIILATLLNTAGGFIGKKISSGRVFEMTAFQLTFGAVILFAAALVFGGTLTFSLTAAGFVVYLAFVSAAAFSVWTALLVFHEAGQILIFNLFIPVTGALWSFFILGEREILDPVYLFSTALITAGIVLVNSHKKPKDISTNPSL